MSKGFMIYYMSTSPAGVNFDREWLESQSYEYVKFMYEKCLKAEEMMIENLEL